MYKTVKTQGKIVYIRCTDTTNLLKNSKSLNEQNRVNSTVNEQLIFRFAKVECT